MDLAAEELQFLNIQGILRESTTIPKFSPRTFYLITLILIFPLSFAILAHSLFTQPILAQLDSIPPSDQSQTNHEWTLLLVYQFIYVIFLFAFSLLSTAAVVFTVASLYTGKPVSFSSTMSAIPLVLKRCSSLLILDDHCSSSTDPSSSSSSSPFITPFPDLTPNPNPPVLGSSPPVPPDSSSPPNPSTPISSNPPPPILILLRRRPHQI